MYDLLDCSDIEADILHWAKNFSGPHESTSLGESQYRLIIERKVSVEAINNTGLKQMPGFAFSWKYSKQLDSWDKYSHQVVTKEYVRYNSIK